MKKSALVCFGIPLIFPVFVLAEEAKSVYELSLKELLAVEVSSASTQSRSRLDSYSTIGKITERQWSLFNAENVFDTLYYQPSIDLHASIGGSSTFSIRGYTGNTASARGKALLFDGIPLNGFAFATAVYSKSFLPTEILSSVEVVRGPISSFYGPDAFHGAVSMFPWQSQQQKFSAELSADDYGEEEISLKSGLHWDNGIANDTVFHAQSLDDSFDPQNLSIPLKLRKDSFTLMNKLQWQDHQFGILINRSDAHGYTDIFSNSTISSAKNAETSLFYYKGEVAFDNWQLLPRAWFHDSLLELHFSDEKAIQYWNDEQQGGQLLVTHPDIFGGFFSLGAEVIYSRVKEAVSKRPDGPVMVAEIDGLSKTTYAFFANYETNLSDSIKTEVGFRYDYFDNSHVSEFSPKIGLIYKSSPFSSWKILYAEGYRAPAAGEIVGTSAFLGNRNLQGETLSTTELSYEYFSEFSHLKVTLFESRWKDAIVVADTLGARSIGLSGEFVNSGKNRAEGIELDATHYLSDNSLYIQSSYSYVSSENSTSGEKYRAFPRHKFSVGLVKNLEQYEYALFYLYKADRTDTPTSEVKLPNFQDIQCSVTKNFENSNLVLKVANVLDREQFEPSIWGVVGGIEQRGRKFELVYHHNF